MDLAELDVESGKMTRVDVIMEQLTPPVSSWQERQGLKLFEWAHSTWHSYVKQILHLLGINTITDERFVEICRELGQVHSDESDQLTAWAGLLDLSPQVVKRWEGAEDLPPELEREEILRHMLATLVNHMRRLEAEAFLKTMLRIVTLVDTRQDQIFCLISPMSHRRSIHRIGLSRRVSNILERSGVKTLHDFGLKATTDQSFHIGTHFAPKKLAKIPGLGPASINECHEVYNAWYKHSGLGDPASMWV